MARETVQSISEYFINDGIEGIELTRDILYYLYYVTDDDNLKQSIIEWFNHEGYCVQCGSKVSETYKCECCDGKD